MEVPCWAKVAVEPGPIELECMDSRQLYSSSRIDVVGSDCEVNSSAWKLA